jgi:predicted metal-dependent HD superfamily phosphohydrolase
MTSTSPSSTSTALPSRLKTRFAALTLSLGALPPTASTWSSTFVARYTQPQRHYHTLAHIDAMLTCLDVHRADLTDAVAVELAVFFHDWVYEPQTSAANEAASVLAFLAFAADVGGGVGEGLRGTVVRLVEATVRHCVGVGVLPGERGDVELFLDFDLEVLGREWAEYEVYASQIRREYACFGEREFNQGRAGVLWGFLERDQVYFSEVFYREKEEAARENMRSEVALLDGGPDPAKPAAKLVS